jgi:hypothetical protein
VCGSALEAVWRTRTATFYLLRRRRKGRKVPVKPRVAHACVFMRTGTALEPFEDFSLIRFGARHEIRRICLEKSLNPRSRRVKDSCSHSEINREHRS